MTVRKVDFWKILKLVTKTKIIMNQIPLEKERNPMKNK